MVGWAPGSGLPPPGMEQLACGDEVSLGDAMMGVSEGFVLWRGIESCRARRLLILISARAGFVNRTVYHLSYGFRRGPV